MNCKTCQAEVFCGEHGTKMIDELEDPDDMPFYYCGACSRQYKTAFGAIVHWCSDMLGVFGGKQQEGFNGDGRDKQNGRIELNISDEQIMEMWNESI